MSAHTFRCLCSYVFWRSARPLHCSFMARAFILHECSSRTQALAISSLPVQMISDATEVQPGSNISSGEAECWTDAMIDKVVLVIVDWRSFRLRSCFFFDMEESRWTRNSPLSSIAEIVQKKPVTTELFRFVARSTNYDTTTSQKHF